MKYSKKSFRNQTIQTNDFFLNVIVDARQMVKLSVSISVPSLNALILGNCPEGWQGMYAISGMVHGIWIGMEVKYPVLWSHMNMIKAHKIKSLVSIRNLLTTTTINSFIICYLSTCCLFQNIYNIEVKITNLQIELGLRQWQL